MTRDQLLAALFTAKLELRGIEMAAADARAAARDVNSTRNPEGYLAEAAMLDQEAILKRQQVADFERQLRNIS